MKKWYNDPAQSGIKAEHGDFPMFSREAIDWAPFKKVLKLYKSELGAKEDKEQAAVKKKRRSRWGVTGEEEKTNGAAPSDKPSAGTKKVRRSRWGSEGSSAITKTQSSVQSLHQQKTFLLRLQIDEINRKLITVVYDAKIAENNPDRSPSPEPIYDNKGKRTNTREVRMRQNLEKKKQDLLEELVRLNPSLKPANMKMSSLTKRIPIPAKEYPGYNFIGLIIGPRGNTQKRMEKETNCKISIRGKGSVKQGRRARDGRAQEDSNEELHVLVQGQDEEGLERACEMISKLLRPVDDQSNDHKQQQLRELAMINGTLREEQYCTNCGQAGHRQWECPNEVERSFTMANVKCAICGDKSHPTSDCPQKNANQTEGQNSALDADYYKFMEMVGGEKAGPSETGPGERKDQQTVPAKVAEVASNTGAQGNLPSSGANPQIPVATNSHPGQAVPHQYAQQQQYPSAQVPTGQHPYYAQHYYYPNQAQAGYYQAGQQWNAHQAWGAQSQWNGQPPQPPSVPLPPQPPQPPPPNPPPPPKG
eukprot:CAMPEP_0184021652 /NCGR_PEP_ID=MMETSP0954-20121128/10069_1 /TAXON_ID=627963 /ORGANISM="Aplanochytrium sp, Strain PBS07" /LENGTH=532 /DNA_ID=CAMNT_0026303739 /DNA_START=192 /DNA_END=1790 /DNA_ORIENTATION=-